MAVDATQVRENVVRFDYEENSPKRNIPIGDVVVINNDEDRENAGFFFDRCRNVFVPNDGRSDLVSATADALHFVHCYGKTQMKNSYVKDTVDDAFNSHGNYMRVNRMEGEKLYLRCCHFEQEGRVNAVK